MRLRGHLVVALSLVVALPGRATAAVALRAQRAVRGASAEVLAAAKSDPVVLEPLCRAQLRELEEALEACERRLDQQRRDHEAALRRSQQRRDGAREVVEEMQREVHEREAELERLNAENTELHNQLMNELERFSHGVSALATAAGTSPPGAENREAAAADAWLRCEDRKTRMQLDVNQCTAKLTAEDSRQEMRQESHEQLASSAEDSVGILRERLDLLREQLASARERSVRLRRQIQAARGVGSAALVQHQQQEGWKEEPADSAREALREAAAVRAAAQAAHREALEASRRLAKRAERSGAKVKASRQDAERLGRDLLRQNATLKEQRRQASEAKAKADHAEDQAGVLHADLVRLANASRDAFKKAFLLDHERSRSKRAYQDALVEARRASAAWEEAQRNENAARFALSRLEARRMRTDWRVAAAVREEAAAGAQAEEARARLRDAEARLAAERLREQRAKADLKAALHEPGRSGGAAAPPRLWGLSLALAVALGSAHPAAVLSDA